MALTQVTSIGLKDGEIVNADLHSAASVALSKLASTGALGSAITATTQSASDDSTKLATTAFVQAAVTSLIDGAPGSLNTLNELAAAINDDSSYATTLTTALATKLPLAGGTLTGTLNVDSGSNGMIDFGDTGSASGRLYADSTGTFVGSKTQHVLWLRTNNIQRIKVSDTSAATSIGGAFTFNAMLTTQGDISGGLLMLKASENTNRFFISGNDTSGCEVNLYDDAGSQKGIVGVSSSEFFLKAPNNSAPLTFYTHNGSSIGERLRITSAGVLSLNDSTPETWATLQINNQSTHNAAQVLIRGADQAQIILRDDTGGTDQKCTTIRNDQGALIFGQHNDAFSAFSEKLRIHSSGVVQIQDSTNATQGNAQLLVRKGAGGGAAPESITRTNSYLHLGGTEWGANAAGVYTLSFGYTNSTTGTNVPAYIGFKETTTSSYTQGDLVFGTKASNSDVVPKERLRITSGGIQSYTGSSADNHYGEVQVRHKTPYSTNGGYPGGTQTTTNQTVFSLYNESYGGNRMAFRSGQGHQLEIETKTRDLGSGSYNDADVYFRVQYDGSLSDRYIIDGYGGHTFKGRTGDTGLNVNSNGHVTKPKQPCFRAKGGSSWTGITTNDGNVNFPMNYELFDNSNNYNNSTYTFTAPVAGKYIFFVQMYFKFDSNVGYMSNYFTKNNASTQENHQIWGYGNTGLYQDQTQSATQIMELAANDYVRYAVRTVGDDADFYGGHCTFSGYLLA